MFVGTYNYTLDPKKRLVIPAKFRPALTNVFESVDKSLYVTFKSAEFHNQSAKFLEIYAPDVWATHLENLGIQAQRSQEAAWYFRKISSDTEMCKLDTQWRILLPTRLVKSADLVRNIMIIGSGPHIEVWDLAKWDEVSELLNNQASQLEKYIYKTQS